MSLNVRFNADPIPVTNKRGDVLDICYRSNINKLKGSMILYYIKHELDIRTCYNLLGNINGKCNNV